MSLESLLVRADEALENNAPLRPAGDFAFDTETHAIRPGLLAPPVVCGSFASRASGASLVMDPFQRQTANGVWPRLLELAKGPDLIIGANIAYDFACIASTVPEAFPIIWDWYEKKRVYDIQIAATLNAIAEGRLDEGDLFERSGRKAIDPKTGKMTNRYSLALCVKEWLGRDDAKENAKFVLQYEALERMPFDAWPYEAKQYPLDDAQNTYDVFEAQVKGGCQNLVDLPAQAHTAFCLHLGAIWGLVTDASRIAPLKVETEASLKKLRLWALEQGLMRLERKKGEQVFVKNTKVIKGRVTEMYAGKPPLTETGQVSADRVTLEESGDEVLEKFSEISKLEKVDGYLVTLEEASKVPLNIRPNVLLASGRSSFEGIIQLLPRKGGVRECIKFRGIGSSVDYAAVELSTLAQVCIWTVGFSDLADAINSGKDPHVILAARLANEGYDAFMKRYQAGDPAAADLRQAGKAGNFGFPGMMGAPKFVIAKRKEGSKVCEWFFRDGLCGTTRTNVWNNRDIERNLCTRCLEVAEEIRAGYIAMWSEIRPYWSYVSSQVNSYGVITQFKSLRRRGIDRAPAAANSYFQGLASEGAKRAVVQLTKEMYVDSSSPLFGSRLTVFAHDESIIDIPELSVRHVHDAAMRQATIMVEQMKTVVPDVAIKAEPALMRYWYKKAEPVFNAEGLLIPWEPKAA